MDNGWAVVAGAAVALVGSLIGTVIGPWVRDRFDRRLAARDEEQTQLRDALLDLGRALEQRLIADKTDAVALAEHFGDIPRAEMRVNLWSTDPGWRKIAARAYSGITDDDASREELAHFIAWTDTVSWLWAHPGRSALEVEQHMDKLLKERMEYSEMIAAEEASQTIAETSDGSTS